MDNYRYLYDFLVKHNVLDKWIYNVINVENPTIGLEHKYRSVKGFLNSPEPDSIYDNRDRSNHDYIIQAFNIIKTKEGAKFWLNIDLKYTGYYRETHLKY